MTTNDHSVTKEELQAFLKPLPTRKIISEQTGMSRRYLYMVSRGERWIPVRHAPAFETATNGLFSRKRLFPEHWQKWWPELALAENADRGAA